METTTGTSETLSRLLSRGAGLAVVDNPTGALRKNAEPS